MPPRHAPRNRRSSATTPMPQATSGPSHRSLRPRPTPSSQDTTSGPSLPSRSRPTPSSGDTSGPTLPSRSRPTSPSQATASDPKPTRVKAPATSAFTSTHYVRNYRLLRLADEMSGKFIGPMPVGGFLNTFLCKKRGQVMPWSPADEKRFKSIKNKRKESLMYGPLINALEPFCPGLEFVNTSANVDPETGYLDPEKLKPDFAGYPLDSGRVRRTQFSLMELWGEVKISHTDDPFNDQEGCAFEHTADARRDTKGQITAYAVAQQGLQFRTHIFSVLVFPKSARILRWDRSGAVVTESFPLHLPFLAEFFWRYNHCSPEDRGYDTTAMMQPSTRDARLARAHLNLSMEAPLVQFEVPDGQQTSYYIASKPTFQGHASPSGRATRTFVVYDPKLKRVVYLKDTWRVDMPGFIPEGVVYKELHAKKVPHIAPLVCAADILGQQTHTQQFASASWAHPIKQKLRPFQHYRLVLGVIGRRLTSFTSTKELISGMKDAVEAHKHAYEDAGFLHRDISAGNIILMENGGLLIDWDLCNRKEHLCLGPRQSERTGTWQFMSAKLLLANDDPNAPRPFPSLEDDVESFIYVLMWVALHCMSNGKQPEARTSFMMEFFDLSYILGDGSVHGGVLKHQVIVSPLPVNGVLLVSHPIIPSLLNDLVATIAARYLNPPTDLDVANLRETLGETSKPDDVLTLLVGKYERAMQRIQSSDWMLVRFNAALDSDNWPIGDKAITNELCYPKTMDPKRKSQIPGLMDADGL